MQLLAIPQIQRNDEKEEFDMIEDIISNTTHRLRVIPKEDFQKCFQQWQGHWNKCVYARREYFERD
jgi:hypothetical protein